jgi:predicted nucleic acid-binding protein
MTIGGVDPIFVDANVLVYAGVLRAPLHQVAMRTIQGFLAAGVDLWISRQIIREYLATLTRPQAFADCSRTTRRTSPASPA